MVRYLVFLFGVLIFLVSRWQEKCQGTSTATTSDNAFQSKCLHGDRECIQHTIKPYKSGLQSPSVREPRFIYHRKKTPFVRRDLFVIEPPKWSRKSLLGYKTRINQRKVQKKRNQRDQRNRNRRKNRKQFLWNIFDAEFWN